MPSTEIEFNTRFADILSEASGQPEGWISAEKDGLLEGSTKRPDFLLDRPGLPPFVVEAKFAESSGDPVKDAAGKLGLECSNENRYVMGLPVRSGAALRYPAGCKQWNSDEMRDKFLLGEATLEWKLVSAQNGEADVFPKNGWIEGDIWDFWESISRTALNVEATEKLGKAVTKLLKAAAKSMLAELENLPGEQKRIAALMGESEDMQAGMEMACVVWLDALLMMNELSREGKKLRPDLKTVKRTSACRTDTGNPSVSKIFREWNKVLGDNYESVFKPAKTALPNEAISFGDMSAAFSFLLDAVEEIESARLGKIANIGGEIFAKVMHSPQRKNTASFYTKPQVAEFLAALTIPSEDVLPADWKEWKLADFACGTGSLLRAGYRRMVHLAERRGRGPLHFHKHMMENNICGLDVSSIAAHLSATTIVNLFPAVSYENMQIGLVKFGVEDGQAYAGSLELSDPKRRGALFHEEFTSLKGDTDSEDGVSRLDDSDGSFAVVIMNPPYSRTGGGQSVADLSGITEEERKQVQKRIGKLRKNTLGNGKAGLASDFISLASQKLRDGGRTGFVLPLTVAAGGSYKKIRQHLIENFSDITIAFFSKGIQSDGESLSDDTALEEIMLIATKGKSGRSGLRYVSLDEPFKSASSAIEAARKIWETEPDIANGGTAGVLYVGGDRIGEWFYSSDPPERWGMAGVRNLGFARSSELLATEGKIHHKGKRIAQFPIAAFSDVIEIGLTHTQVGFLAEIVTGGKAREGVQMGAFKCHKIETSSDAERDDLSLWHAKYDLCGSVNVEPTHYGIEHNQAKAPSVRESKTDMFIQKNMRWNSQKVLIGRTSELCLSGGSWIGLLSEEPHIKDALSIWINSIFGFAAYWYQSQRQKPGRSQMQLGDTSEMLVPDFRSPEMQARAKQVLSDIDIADMFGGKLDRAYFCESDQHRQKFNKAAATMLGIPEEQQDSIIDYLQRAWTDEPSVTPGK